MDAIFELILKPGISMAGLFTNLKKYHFNLIGSNCLF